MSEICAKCNSDKIIPKASVGDREHGTYHNLQIFIDEKPLAMLFKNRTYSDVFAKVCGSCGFTEIYTKSYKEIYDAHKRKQEQSN